MLEDWAVALLVLPPAEEGLPPEVEQLSHWLLLPEAWLPDWPPGAVAEEFSVAVPVVWE